MSPQPSWKSFSLSISISMKKKLSLILAYKLRPPLCSFCPSLLHHTHNKAIVLSLPFSLLYFLLQYQIASALSPKPKGHFFIRNFFFKNTYTSLSICLSHFACLVFIRVFLLNASPWLRGSHCVCVHFLCVFQNHLILRKECLHMRLQWFFTPWILQRYCFCMSFVILFYSKNLRLLIIPSSSIFNTQKRMQELHLPILLQWKQTRTNLISLWCLVLILSLSFRFGKPKDTIFFPLSLSAGLGYLWFHLSFIYWQTTRLVDYK